jgi:hypothetical protein
MSTNEELRAGGSTIEQLRSDIDHGRTGDKVEGSDPAAAPLGADEEAAGTAVPSSAVRAARDLERKRGPNAAREKRSLGAAWVLIGFIVVLAIGVLSWMFLR